MDDKKKRPKKIEPVKIEKIKLKDLLFRKFPPARIKITNEYGQLVLSEISLALHTPADWINMKYFWTHLLPRLIPPNISGEPEDKNKKGSYVG